MTTRAAQWSDEEMGFIADNPRMTARDIAEHLGRTAEAVRVKRYKLRRGWEPKGPSDWTEDEDYFLLTTANLTAAQVAEKLIGRSTQGVRYRRKELAKAHGVDFGDYATRNKDPKRIGRRPLVAKTCLGCGLLLDSTWYNFDRQKRQWFSRCKACRGRGRVQWKGERRRSSDSLSRRSQQGAEYRQRMARLTEPGAVMRGQTWTTSDERVLSDPDLSLLEKALMLKRTYAGVATQCSKLNYTSRIDPPLGDPSLAQWFIDAPHAADALWEAS